MRTLTVWCAVVIGACSRYDSEALERDAGTGVPDAQAPPKVLYVSASDGSEANPGTTLDRPLKTIGAALSRIDQGSLEGYEVHVCRGVYEEPNLVIRRSLTLRGSYNCATWTRSGEFGQRTGFKDANLTTVTDGKSGASGAIVRVSNVTGVTLEGFSFEKTGTGAALALAGSTVTISESQVLAASAPSLAEATIGIHAETSKLTATQVNVTGGAGATTAPEAWGSTAVRLDASHATIRNANLQAGSGKGMRGAACVAIEALGTEPAVTIEGSQLRGGASEAVPQPSGGTADTTGYAFAGVWSRGAVRLTVERNLIEGGSSATRGVVGGYAMTVGIKLGAGAPVSIQNNRIIAGEITGPGESYCEAVDLNGVGPVVVRNNVAVAACTRPSATSGGAWAAYLAAPHVFQHNTVVAVGANSFAAILDSSDTPATSTVENNVLWANTAIRPIFCRPVQLVSARNNVLGHTGAFAVETVSTAACTVAQGGAELLGGPAVAGFNIATGSFTTMFEPTQSVAAMVEAARSQRIAARTDQCPIVKTGLGLLAQVPRDLDGAPRGEPPTIGAWETCP